MAPSQRFTLPHLPELYDHNFLDVLLPPAPAQAQPMDVDPPEDPPKNPFIDALESTAHRTRTENNAMAYDSTFSATLDAFNGLNPYASGKDLENLLENAWKEDSELTLRLIWQQRSIHEGKSEKEGFYRAFGWLYKNHPRTAIQNLRMLVSNSCPPSKAHPDGIRSHGYWKDLLNILALALDDELDVVSPSFFDRPKFPYTYPRSKPKPKGGLEAHRKHNEEQEKKAQEKRFDDSIKQYSKLSKLLEEDQKYRALYVMVARLFADRLAEDLRVLGEIQKLPKNDERIRELQYKISLAGKWAPTPGASHDKHTNISSAIVLLLHHNRAALPIDFPKSVTAFDTASSSPAAVEEALGTLRSFFQRWVLTPLRAVALVPESKMAANKWEEIRYNRVPSVCMKNNMERFFQHDQVGFEKYLAAVESGKKGISGGTLMPHQLVSKAIQLGDAVQARDSAPQEDAVAKTAKQKLSQLKAQMAENQIRVVEAQWKALIDKLRESGKLENAIAICDVSGSMGDAHWSSSSTSKQPEPILPALALSLVLAQLAKPPFDSGFITFSADPQYIKLDKNVGLFETLMNMVSTAWGMNTDFEGVFLKLILPLAVKNNIKQEDMIKRLFVFSDMQFDSARTQGDGAEGWKTNYDVIKEHYEKAGYKVPEIVYWDLAAGGTVEVGAEQEGVAMMNGFSPALMKVFMGEAEEEEEGWEKVGDEKAKEETEEEKFDPLTIMKKAAMRKSFDGLVVLD
ncbi:hypothetical protein V5O48_000987 [Marasmius crinis-equi]|uniref:DUF2828 domain-containing protein n=1 Tax=Marasmius crinis-equi TaxID=585013 RepID=A0ABR3G030_9AGAR